MMLLCLIAKPGVVKVQKTSRLPLPINQGREFNQGNNDVNQESRQ
ncbi:hypothetical protein ALP45_04147 [Pseudomonas coronafaciens pv. atropurpurea]|nr:Unknown protein sequence [Pseudomonas coronafaciens pv. atropurpurea]RMT54265.1 hypothetical protein ALP45_04147 [Pseudomonas coronafaciens pv. atropurpurea]